MTLWKAVQAPALPPAPPLSRPMDNFLCVALGILGFMLPWSSAGTSITLFVLLIFSFIVSPQIWRCAPWRDPIMAAGLVLLAYIIGHTLLVSGFTPATLKAVNRYHELLMAPILLALFRLATRKELFFRCMVIGSLGYAVAHWIGQFVPAVDANLETRRISAGFGMALVAFVLLEQARHRNHRWVRRIGAAFLALTVLFAVEARTGYLMVLLLAVAAGWLHSPYRWRWRAAMGMLVMVLALAMTSGAVHKRMSDTLGGATPTASGNLTSTGIRLELLRNGLDLASRNFLIGGGFAHYADIHEQAVKSRYGEAAPPQAQVNWTRSSNPHSEYLMQLVGGGVASLALFLLWLVLPMVRKGPSGHVRASLFGIALAFALGCLFNSLLMDFVEGHLYGALLAWLLAQSSQQPPAPPAHTPP